MFLDIVAVSGFGAEPMLFYAPAYSGIREGSVVRCETRFGSRIGMAVGVCTLSTESPAYEVIEKIAGDQFPLNRVSAFADSMREFVYEEDDDGQSDND